MKRRTFDLNFKKMIGDLYSICTPVSLLKHKKMKVDILKKASAIFIQH